MPITIVAQDLITISLDPAGTARQVTQNEAEWVDLGPYQDVAMLTYISQQGYQSSSGGASGSLQLEVSPLKEDAIFPNFSLAIAANTAPSGWTNQANVHLTSGSSFPQRYLRWRLVGPTANGTATWTFRIILSVNPAPR
jgi:hypothetical protein